MFRVLTVVAAFFASALPAYADSLDVFLKRCLEPLLAGQYPNTDGLTQTTVPVPYDAKEAYEDSLTGHLLLDQRTYAGTPYGCTLIATNDDGALAQSGEMWFDHGLAKGAYERASLPMRLMVKVGGEGRVVFSTAEAGSPHLIAMIDVTTRKKWAGGPATEINVTLLEPEL